jgi:hypothetical protein
MPKSEQAKKWIDAKRTFEQAAQRKKPAPGTIKILGLVIDKGAGVQKALADFDSAMNKKHRKDAALAYQKAWELSGAYTDFVGSHIHKMKDDDRALDPMRMMVATLSQIVSGLKPALEALQQEKGQKLDVRAFLADFEGQYKAYEKVTKSDKTSREREKEYKVMKTSEPCLKALKAYTVAASRADAAQAKKALDEFDAAAQKFENGCAMIHNLVGSMREYKTYSDALEQFRNLSKVMRTGRVDTERKSLANVILSNN